MTPTSLGQNSPPPAGGQSARGIPMKLLSKLFPSRAATVRQAGRPARKPRLGIESLDDRCLPSVSSALSGGVLTLTADNAGSIVAVANDNTLTRVFVGSTWQNVSGPVNKIVFKGGSGNDLFNNMSSIDALVYGSAGQDNLIGGFGNNILDRNGYR